MVKALVTGAAGFIGSHLVERLLAEGYRVLGLDRVAEAPYLALLQGHPHFQLVVADLGEADLEAFLGDVEVVFHLAGQPGVRQSWGAHFPLYTRHNVDATQRLLEAVARRPVQRLVFASTSSVYGDVPVPMREDGPTRPVSPYGVTKLAAEHLCYLYFRQFGVPAVRLRYFTVYGPRQRSDMAFHQFIRRALAGQPIVLYGGGRLKRDFTYVGDVVSATLLAAQRGEPGQVYNVGGGSQVSLAEAVATLEAVLGQPLDVRLDPQRPEGDMAETLADITRARAELGWSPQTDLATGLHHQVAWMRRTG